MKALLASLLLIAVVAPAAAQVVVRRPVPVPPVHFPRPDFPDRDPWRHPTPEQMCFGQRRDRLNEATRAAAQERLDRFEIEKAVECTLTSADYDYATGKCVEANGELFARLKMSFSVDCHSRTPSAKLRKTTIKYY